MFCRLQFFGLIKAGDVCLFAGLSSERPVRVLDITARPTPLRTPGRVKLSALVNVTADLPIGLNADVVVSKLVLGLHLKIPCYRNIGSWYDAHDRQNSFYLQLI